jgi:hypothetical protein
MQAESDVRERLTNLPARVGTVFHGIPAVRAAFAVTAEQLADMTVEQRSRAHQLHRVEQAAACRAAPYVTGSRGTQPRTAHTIPS